MKKLIFILALGLAQMTHSCEISLLKTTLDDEYFSVNFTEAVIKILNEKNIRVDVYNLSPNTITSSHSTYTDTSWFHLKRAVTEITVTWNNQVYSFKGNKKCIMMSCGGNDYKKSIIQALSFLKNDLPSCQ